MKKKLIITENQYKKLKENLIKENSLDEYDYEGFDMKYGAMPDERKEKVTNWAKDRQLSQGVRVKALKNDGEMAIIPNDIEMTNERAYFEDYLKMKREMDGNHPLSEHIKNHQKAEFRLTARNAVHVNSESKSTGVVDIILYGKLEPLNDKDFTKLRFNVIQTILKHDGTGRMVPVDRKAATTLVNKITEEFLETYGKYTGKNLFIPEIVIHPNTFMR